MNKKTERVFLFGQEWEAGIPETSPSRDVTPTEAQAVEEIINEELDNVYHERIALSQCVCPVCYTELSEDINSIDSDLTETVYYCPRCGYESDPHYE